MGNTFTPLRRGNIADKVFQQLMEKVSNGEWKAGDKIPSENELSESLQVSRNTVRQALQKMNALGIAEARQGEGTYIKKIDTSFYVNLLIPSVFLGEQDQRKLFEFEKCIQEGAVVLACEKATEQELKDLSDKLEMMKRAGDNKSYNDADIDFHVYLAEITHNEMFGKAMQIIKSMLTGGLSLLVDEYGTEESIQAHERIVEALCRRDADAAGLYMKEHMDDIRKKLDSVLQKRGSVD